MSVRVLIAVSLIGLVGCASNEPPSTKLTALPYYPITKSSRWEYQGPKTNRIVEVVKLVSLKGSPCALIRTTEKGKGFTLEYVHTNTQGVFVVATGKNMLSSPIPLLKMPLEPDNHWSFKIRPKKTILQARYLVEPEESVKVPLGEYSAIPVRGELYDDGKRVQRLSYWFAKDVGLIKQQIETQQSTVTYELTAYQP